jgi:phospholipid-transporting ATPase
MLDTLWQSVVIFFVPLLAYWGTDIDGPSLGDLWTLALVIVVNLHLAMDVIEWNWITHNAIWGSIVATWICVIVIDAVPSLIGYWAMFVVAKQQEFWLCLLAIIVGSLVPRLVVKVLSQFYCPSDIQISRELEKFGNGAREERLELEMNEYLDRR